MLKLMVFGIINVIDLSMYVKLFEVNFIRGVISYYRVVVEEDVDNLNSVDVNSVLVEDLKNDKV